MTNKYPLVNQTLLLAGIMSLSLFACNSNPDTAQTPTAREEGPLFSKLPASHTGVNFRNDLPPNNPLENITNFDHYYNGAGLAVGDINNDGLADIYMVGNKVPNKLYLNKGNFQFEDITQKAGVAGEAAWNNGANMVDINGDGWLDIYVTIGGMERNVSKRANQLFINNQDGTFAERGAEIGLDDKGYGVQAAFLDYDRDGDLDCYIINNYFFNGSKRENLPKVNHADPNKNPYDLYTGDQFYKNENGVFINVTKEIGIFSHAMGYGLGVAVGDYNNDGWPDMYLSNDYTERDFFYVNQKNGKFKDELTTSFPHVSRFSMGNDVADFNGDGLLDLMIVDMTAEDNYRQKTNMASMNPKIFYEMTSAGFHYQYMYNSVQLNQGNNRFSDVAQLTGMAMTDWSWAILFADFQNDGLKDVFVTNGFRKEVRNKDWQIRYTDRLEVVAQMEDIKEQAQAVKEIIDEIPSTPTPNYIFENKGNLNFEKKMKEWGLDDPTYSNGAAYADLNNDGLLDLVISNVDNEALIYQNNGAKKPNHYLRVRFEGQEKNRFGLGARVILMHDGQQQMHEHYTSRGYLSSVEPVMHFGLGESAVVDKLTVIWPDGKQQELRDVAADRLLTLRYEEAQEVFDYQVAYSYGKVWFEEATKALGVQFRHRENAFDDFGREVLLPHRMSRFGPGLAVGDANGDGLEDFFVGGARGQAPRLFVQKATGGFAPLHANFWAQEAQYEDVDAVFLDADRDGDMDLYVVSGGYDVAQGHALLQDRLYLNQGDGQFGRGVLPASSVVGSKVRPADIDGDGDLDLFVGGRVKPGYWPHPVASQVLRNDGGQFVDITADFAPELLEAGLVTDAQWLDLNNDQKMDLAICGEWMPVRVFVQEDNKMVEKTEAWGLDQHTGWWYSLTVANPDQDGDPDLIAGNLGLNYKYRASFEQPFQVYSDDFNQDGQNDIVLSYFEEGKCFPLRGKQCSSEQIPELKKKFETYHEFGVATLNEVYGEQQLNNALQLNARTFASAYLENTGASFEVRPLPNEAQVSNINSTLVHDFDGDGHLDLAVCGNLHTSEVETPRNDASYGLVMLGDGKGSWQPVSPAQSGLYLGGDVKGIYPIKLGARGELGLLVATNDAPLRLLRLHSPQAPVRLAGK